MELEKLSKFIINKLDEMKIENILLMDVEKTSLAKYIIVGTGRGERHIESSIEKLRTDLKQEDIAIPNIEGKYTDWLLLDLYNIIVHLFTEESRIKYNLEELWR